MVDQENVVEAFERVKKARAKDRLKISDYIHNLFDGFVEFKGDRLSRDDSSILGGIAEFGGLPVTVIGHRKGNNLQENLDVNFGMASPEGYRKALRLMKQAEKFGRPIITIIDTPGAYPGVEAENHGQAASIAENLAVMSGLKVPIIAIVTGEGSSGGALALAVADQVWMLENAVYSILSPEGFASILWKDGTRAAEASELMRITAQDLYEFGVIDRVFEENEQMFEEMKVALSQKLFELGKLEPHTLLDRRYKKFRTMGKVAYE